MKNVYTKPVNPYGKLKQPVAGATAQVRRSISYLRLIISVILSLSFSFYTSVSVAQLCPSTGTTTLAANPNTYYQGIQSAVPAATSSITLGPIGTGTNFGNTPISSGDILLIIQMQGAKITVPATVTSSGYGDGTGIGTGFLTTNLMAGNMEFIVATSAVPTTGGTLNISAGLTNSYANIPYGTDGQYTYQVIRVGTAYNITLSGTINTAKWNGATGGVTILNAVNQIDFAGQIINAKGAGFRGGGTIRYTGAAGTNKNDFYTLSTTTANGGKGEGIAGTPAYVYFNGILPTAGVEGYPGGSRGRGAPATAGGGATDSNPTSNDQNAGGGGGGNGGAGGGGGNGWFSAGTTGGRGGSAFKTTGPATTYYSPSRLIIGGGGGGGSNNDNSGTPSGIASSGASGGGLVIISATTIIGVGTIDASGALPNSTVTVDGSGGGGAGGSILIYANSGQAGLTADASGGAGSSNTPGGATQHGPGGGGGGGVIFSNAPLNGASTVAFGSAGISTTGSVVNSFGAVKGNVGSITSNIPFSSLPPNMQICQVIILPVTLLDFSASYVSSNNAKVSWSTTDETNVDYFVVERSSDANSFVGVSTVQASESLSAIHSYTINDQLYNISSDIVYYRLRIVDKDGRFTYSKVIPVKLGQPENTISVFPNPVDNYFIVNIFADKPGNGMLRLMDNTGKQILTKQFTVTNGNNSVVIEQLGYLPKAIYILQISLNNSLFTQKLVKN